MVTHVSSHWRLARPPGAQNAVSSGAIQRRYISRWRRAGAEHFCWNILYLLLLPSDTRAEHPFNRDCRFDGIPVRHGYAELHCTSKWNSR